MSNETKETTAAPEGAEQQSVQQPEKAAPKAQKAKSEAKAKVKAEGGASALKAVGEAACKRHKLAQVWVTSDGQCFPEEGDAKEHAKNLPSKETIKVSAK